MMSIDPRIGAAGSGIMGVLSYVLLVVNFADGDAASGVIFAIIGVFFTRVTVRAVRRMSSDQGVDR